jgi:hypothetical protein
VSGAFASGSLVRADGSSTTLSGVTNTTVNLSVPVLHDRVTFAAAVVLPTGKARYTDDEAQVAGVMAADLLPFRLSNFGSGSALDLSSQFAASVGGVNLGARLGYQMGQEFDLLEGGSFAYRPGNQAYARIAADGDIGDSRAAAQVTVYTFSDDQLNSKNLYRSGTRVQALASYSMPAGHASTLQAYVGAQHRQHGTFLDGSAETPTQTVLLVGGGLRSPTLAGIIMPQFDLRILRSGDGAGQGYVGGAGLGMELGLGDHATLLPSARFRIGKVGVRSGVESGISGFDVGLGFRFGGIL